MAIYSYQLKPVISRKIGQSSVASAAYRSGEKIEDEKTGLVHDYTKKQDILYKEILIPETAPERLRNRSQLWNEVEKVERRSDSQLAYDRMVALPKELNLGQQIELIKKFAKENYVDKHGFIVDVCIHDQKNGNGNIHAHMLITTRYVNENGFLGKNREFNPDFANKDGGKKGYIRENNQVKDERILWERYANEALQKAGVNERIDHRSLKEQGVDRIPQIHLGPTVNAMEKKGIETERGNINREVIESNKKLQEIKNEKIILINEYKSAKENHQKVNNFFKQFNQEERESVLKAQSILRKYATLENVSSYKKQLDKNILFWNGLDDKLTKKMKSLEEANYILDKLKNCREEFKQARLFSQERKELKERISSLEEKFNNKIQYIEKYKNYGIKNEKTFENKYSELKLEEMQKREKYETARQNIYAKKKIIDNAEIILKEAECRKFVKSYREFEVCKNVISQNAAKAINDINRVASTKLTFEKIKELGDISDKINKDTERLLKAEKHITEYEKLKELSMKHENAFGQFKRVFSGKLEDQYKELQRNMESTKKALNNCSVMDREELVKQQQALNKAINNLPQWYREYDLKIREKEINNRLYQLYRQEKRYEVANDLYNELRQQRTNLSPEKQELKNIIQKGEEKFNKLRVGSEKDFEGKYASVKNEILLKRNSLQCQKEQLDKIVDVSQICEISIKARNAIIEIHNNRYINDYYKKENTERVVNGNEYRAGFDQGSSRRDKELNGWARGISTEGNRCFESPSIKPGGQFEIIQRADRKGQRDNNSEIQRNDRGNQQANSNNSGKLLETTTGGIKESPGNNEIKQNRNDIRSETNDREVSSKNRTSVFAKNSNSIFNSRFKSSLSTNIQDSSKLDRELLKQINESKSSDNVKSKEEENIKTENRER